MPPSERTTSFEERRFHFHQMPALGEAAFIYIGDVFAEGGEAFLLEAAVFGGEVAVGFGVARRAFVVIAEMRELNQHHPTAPCRKENKRADVSADRAPRRLRMPPVCR